MNPTPDGPEHLPLPHAPRGGARRTGDAHPAAAGAPISYAVAVLAFAFAGGGVWLAGAREAAAPKTSTAPRLTMPSRPAAAAPPAVLSPPPAAAAEPARTSPLPVAPRPANAAPTEPPRKKPSSVCAMLNALPKSESDKFYYRLTSMMTRALGGVRAAGDPAAAPPIDEDLKELMRTSGLLDATEPPAPAPPTDREIPQ